MVGSVRPILMYWVSYHDGSMWDYLNISARIVVCSACLGIICMHRKVIHKITADTFTAIGII